MDAAFAAPGRVHHEGGHVEAADQSTDLFLDVRAGGDGGAQVLDPLHHVVHVDVIRMDVDIGQTLDERAHGGPRVVHAAHEHGLVAHHDSALVELVGRGLCDPGDLARMVEVGVNHHVDVRLAPLFHDASDGIDPGMVAEDLLRQI